MSPIVWIIVGVGLIALLASGKGNKGKKKDTSQEKPIRIDHLHYIDADEYECSVCGAKFWKDRMVCPECGVKFEGTKEDDEEFIDEMIIWDDD